MDAMNPQNSSGCCLIRNGPGDTPWTIMAASITAGIGPEGTPRASIGTNAPDVAELLADSGPATPATAPFPNSSGRLESLRSIAYDTKLEMMCAEPGITPIRKPSTVPRPIGAADSPHSRREGNSSRSLGLITAGGVGWPAVARISARPKRPTATGTMPMPSPSSTTP